jgi:hypothetical protein
MTLASDWLLLDFHWLEEIAVALVDSCDLNNYPLGHARRSPHASCPQCLLRPRRMLVRGRRR